MSNILQYNSIFFFEQILISSKKLECVELLKLNFELPLELK
jgi:hypothetical protein